MPIPNLFYGPLDGTNRGASPTALAVGDSWFWHPFDSLLGEIACARPNQSIVVAGYNGSEASEWGGKYANSIDTTFNLLVLQGLEWVACVAATLSLGLRAEVTRWTAPSFTDSCLA